MFTNLFLHPTFNSNLWLWYTSLCLFFLTNIFFTSCNVVSNNLYEIEKKTKILCVCVCVCVCSVAALQLIQVPQTGF